MRDILFLNQNALELDDLLDHAKRAGANPIRVAAELAAGTHTERVLEDARGAMRCGIRTPALFVNGVRYDNPWAEPAVFINTLQQVAAIASAH